MTSRVRRLRDAEDSADDAAERADTPGSGETEQPRGGRRGRPPRPRPAPKRTPLAMMVLGLLAESPMHPYEMQRRMSERAKDQVIRVQRGSLYPAVERLVRAGLVDRMETSREGRRPERTVYEITDVGRDVVENWLIDMLREPQSEFPEFPAALAFLALLTPAEATSALEHRSLRLTSALGGMDAIGEQMQGRLPRLFYLESEFQRAMLAAELSYVRSLLTDLRSGEITWSAEILESWIEQYEWVGNATKR